MNEPAEESNRLRVLSPAPCNSESVLSYLEKMAAYSRKLNHREMVWYYDAAWEFAAGVIYGKLPPLQQFSTGQDPDTIRTQFPAGVARPPSPWPMRKIIKTFIVPWNHNDYTYETLECYHVLSAPVGWSAPNKSRRCIHCAIASSLTQPKKKSVASASSAPIAKAKVVGA